MSEDRNLQDSNIAPYEPGTYAIGSEQHEKEQRELWEEWRKDALSMIAKIERQYGMRRTVRCPRCGHKFD